MWRLSGELAVNCSTLVDLPRQTHGLRWMRDELMAGRMHSIGVSVTGRFAPSLDVSPPGRFAPWTFSPPGRFAPVRFATWTFHPLTGRFAPVCFSMCLLF